MLCHLYRAASAEKRSRIAAALSTPRDERQTGEVQWIRRQMIEAGSLDYARTIACALGASALNELQAIFEDVPDSEDKAFIGALVTWSLERLH